MENKANWSDSDDLDMMFHNTFSAEFYRKLHRYIHQVHRKAKAQKLLNTQQKSQLGSFTKALWKVPYHTLGAWYYRMQLKQHEIPVNHH